MQTKPAMVLVYTPGGAAGVCNTPSELLCPSSVWAVLSSTSMAAGEPELLVCYPQLTMSPAAGVVWLSGARGHKPILTQIEQRSGRVAM